MSETVSLSLVGVVVFTAALEAPSEGCTQWSPRSSCACPRCSGARSVLTALLVGAGASVAQEVTVEVSACTEHQGRYSGKCIHPGVHALRVLTRRGLYPSQWAVPAAA